MQNALDSILLHDMIRIKQELSTTPLVFMAPECQLIHSQMEWLRNHSDIRFTGDPNWLPCEGFDKDGNYIGIVAEHLKLLEERLNIRFNIVRTKNWEESVHNIRTGRADVISETTDSALGSLLIFTDPYLKNPIVIIMDSNQSYGNCTFNEVTDSFLCTVKKLYMVLQ